VGGLQAACEENEELLAALEGWVAASPACRRSGSLFFNMKMKG